ncbi:MAG: oxygen-independent coproporphyrinogen III oxidase [Candidatus Kapabacteria bacterium]|nr:oxygen-independent coproporphyrinogen III oxidase [Candidatus Kapabacteria bacterium]
MDQYLLDKYNAPVPRYTSYPPANHFSDKFTSSDYETAIIESNELNPQNVSIYVHIPFCKKLCFYCGCNKISMHNDEMIKKYIETLKIELHKVLKLINPYRLLSQIHYGGGTPNAIDSKYLGEINSIIFSYLKTIESPEIAIECNPAYLDFQYIKDLTDAGFNRFSIGIQDFNIEVLKTVNRSIPELPVKEIINIIKDLNPNAVINFDFIYGLPGQNSQSFAKSIDEAISYNPDRIVTFSYAHLPTVFKAQYALEKAGLPSPEEKIEMYQNTNIQLKENGYMPVGMDHYVREDDELYQAFKNNLLHRNFQGYCTRRTTGQVYAFGISSISQFETSYFQTTKSIESYIETINKDSFPVEKGYRLNNNEIIVREVIEELMCNKKIDLTAIALNFDISLDKLKSHLNFDESSLQNFIRDGIINYSNNIIEISEMGILFIRNVAASLDPVYKNKVMNYSKAV